MRKRTFAVILLVGMMFILFSSIALAEESDGTNGSTTTEPSVNTAPQNGPEEGTPSEQGDPQGGGDTGTQGGNTTETAPETTPPLEQEQPTVCEHVWEEERVEATCTKEGYVQRKCSVCGTVEKIETLPVIEHSWKYKKNYPTCTEGGNYTRTCLVCGEYEVVETYTPFGHRFVEAEVNGVITRVCANCLKTEAEIEQGVTPKCTHSWKYETTRATCTEEGSYSRVCLKCGEREVITTYKATGHKYRKTVADGITTYTCTVCGDTYTEKTETPKCTYHSWKYETTQPTCTEEGSYSRVCTKCGEREVISTYNALGHKYEEKVTRIATTTHDGELTYTCKTCGDTYTKTIPRLDAPEEDPIVADPNAVANNSYSTIENEYYRFPSKTVWSYLYQRADDNLTRVEAINEGNGKKVLIENYDPKFNLLTSQKIDQELPIFGGFYSGQMYNFMVFGQSNPSFSDSVEVIRVVKYDKNWRRLDQFSLMGANTSVPFDFGSLRMTEAGDQLLIHTCHKMYRSSDGLCHQANMTLVLRQSDMKLTDKFYEVVQFRYGYVSHSFNQFILADSNANIVTLDHGDGYPRAAVIVRFNGAAGKEKFLGENSEILNVQEFVGGIGESTTGFKLGGFEESSSNYLIAGAIDEQSGNFDSSNAYNIVIYAVDKDNLTKSGVKKYQVSSYTNGQIAAAGNPQLVKIANNKFVLLWNEHAKGNTTGTLKYTIVDGDGRCGKIYTADAFLSDCQPIEIDGKAVWYYGGGDLPVFCSVDGNGNFKVERDLAAERKAAAAEKAAAEKAAAEKAAANNTAVNNSVSYVGDFRDVKVTSWYAGAVKWASEENLMGAVSNGIFGPNDNASRAMIVTVMYRMAGQPSTTAVGFSDVSRNQWYAQAVDWAANGNVVNGVGENKFAPNSDITRQELAAILYRYAEQAGYDTEFDQAQARNVCSSFKDYNKVSGWAEDAILWANTKGLIAGNSDGTLNPGGKATRAEIATIMMRFVQNNQ